MRLSWKLFFITTPIFVLFLTVFGIWIIQDSFDHSLGQAVEQCMAENQTFQNSYELTSRALSEEQWNQTTMKKVVSSFHKSREAGDGNARIYDADGSILYEDNGLTLRLERTDKRESDAGKQTRIETAGQRIMKTLTEEENTGYVVGSQAGQWYVTVVSRSSSGNYIETTRNISSIYENRDAMYARYQIGVILLTVLVGCVILFILFFVMRNIQKLSRVTRQFARGQYDARVKIKSEDEVGRLAEDFNWMADAMSRQMEQLQYEVRRQEEFTAAFAHELKTPLTSIIGYADTIRQMELSKEETDMCADYIFRQGKRLQTLAYKLLEMTMAGNQEITLQEISVPEFLQEIRKTAAESLKEKQLTLLAEAEPGLIYGDRDLLASLFLNLVDNARKASEPGKRIWLTGHQRQGGYLIFVADEGRGIPKDELARITEAFYMVDKSRSRKEGGAGLGLALCQKIVELHGAMWRFESEVGQGLRVSVMFWDPERQEAHNRRDERRTKATRRALPGRDWRAGHGKDMERKQRLVVTGAKQEGRYEKEETLEAYPGI